MILVVGGMASGKRTFARSLGEGLSIAYDVHEAAREEVAVDDLVARYVSCDVVTCADVGAGIVPLDAGERAWRERVGALSQQLAARADVVVRMVCGVPLAMKGELS